MEYKDYYKVLGVKKNASAKDIKSAYRKLARQHHPDVNQGNKDAEVRFKEINEAYEVLGDEERRKKYDELGERWPMYEQWRRSGGEASGQPFDWGGFQASPGAGAGPGGARYEYRTMSEDDLRDLFGEGGGFSDFFSTFFGPGGSTFGRAGGRTRGAPPRMPGEDYEHPVEVSLEEAFNGTTRLLQFADPQGGPGRRIEARIPPGVTDGSRVRLVGQGGPGIGGGQAGDLFLRISVAPHPRYERKGDDLYTKVQVPLYTAVLGGEVELTTLKGGRIMLKIAPESQNNQSIRLRGQGMPVLGQDRRGDLYAQVQVVLPTNLSAEERELFQRLAALRGASAGSRVA